MSNAKYLIDTKCDAKYFIVWSIYENREFVRIGKHSNSIDKVIKVFGGMNSVKVI